MYEFYMRVIYILLCGLTTMIAICICCTGKNTIADEEVQTEEERAEDIRSKIICKVSYS